MWETLSAALLWFLEEWGEAAIFVVLLLEEAGVPLPLPADLALIWEGSRVAAGRRLFVVALLVVEVATAIGASILYWLARRGGRPLLLRYGRFLHLDAGKLRRAEGWVQRNAAATVILGRIVPGFRITTPFAAGVFRVPYRTFLPSLAAGTLVTSSFWMGMGFFFGPSALAAVEAPSLLILRLALSVVLLGVLLGVTWKIHRAVLPNWRGAALAAGARRIEAAALAGLLATLEMAMALGILLTGFMVAHVGVPEQALLQALALIATGHGTRLGPAFVPVAGVLFFLAGLLWALPYALWCAPRLPGPDWLRGVLFSALPTAVSWLVVLPLLGAGPLGLGLGAGLVPAAGEAVRHALYGAALGLSYPVLLLARRPWHTWRVRRAQPLDSRAATAA